MCHPSTTFTGMFNQKPLRLLTNSEKMHSDNNTRSLTLGPKVKVIRKNKTNKAKNMKPPKWSGCFLSNWCNNNTGEKNTTIFDPPSYMDLA